MNLYVPLILANHLQQALTNFRWSETLDRLAWKGFQNLKARNENSSS